jgi:hypothetical protein
VPENIVWVDASDKPSGTSYLQSVFVKLYHYSLALEIVPVCYSVKDRFPGYFPGKIRELQLPKPLFLDGANAVVDGH